MENVFIQNDIITLRSSGKFAGAFDSLVWNGKEFLNNADPGRELQSACAKNDLGEAFNPTEAMPASVVLERTATGNTLHSRTQMGFWNPVNGNPLSDYILTRDVIVGHSASPNIIDYKVIFRVPEDCDYVQFEALTGYMPPEFSFIYECNSLTGEIFPATSNSEGWDIPGIMATVDGKYAMGCYSPDINAIWTGFTDADVVHAGCVKWNMVFRNKPCPKGDYTFQMFVIVGTLDDVRLAMKKLVNPGEVEMLDQMLKYRRFKAYYESLMGLTFTNQEYDDKMNTIGDFLEQSRRMGEDYQKAYLIDPGYADQLFNWWINNEGDTQALLNAMHTLASQNPPEPEEWTPPQSSGLHLLVDVQDGQERFCVVRYKKGLKIGTYGFGMGGARIESWDGNTGQRTVELQTDRESIFDMVDTSDGRPLACSEHYGSIYKRTSDDGWGLKYARPEQPALMLGLRPAGNYINGLWISSFGGQDSGLVRSNDNGETWEDAKAYSGKALYGIGSDGNTIMLTGQQDNYPVLCDVNGTVIVAHPDLPGYGYWGICGANGLWNVGSWNGAAGGFIDAYDGTLTRVYETDRHYIQHMENDGNHRFAIATNDWDATGTSLLLHSLDGYNWGVLCEVPCPSIFSLYIKDGGVYLAGGRYQDYGRVYFYKV